MTEKRNFTFSVPSSTSQKASFGSLPGLSCNIPTSLGSTLFLNSSSSIYNVGITLFLSLTSCASLLNLLSAHTYPNMSSHTLRDWQQWPGLSWCLSHSGFKVCLSCCSTVFLCLSTPCQTALDQDKAVYIFFFFSSVFMSSVLNQVNLQSTLDTEYSWSFHKRSIL